MNTLNFRCTPIISICLALVLITILPPDVIAGPITGKAKALGKFTVQNKSKFPNGAFITAKDFHIKIKSDNENLNVIKTDGGVFGTSVVGGNGSKEVTIDFLGGEVPGGNPEKDKNTFSIEVKQKENTIRIVESYWTGESIDVQLDDAPIPGFKAEGDPIYTIFNDFAGFSIGIRDLQFLSNVPELDDLILLPGLTPGFGSVEPDFILSPLTSMIFNIPGIIDPGNYLYAQGKLFDVGSGDTIGSFIHGHQAPVPEPGSFLLLATGILSLLGYGWRNGRTSRNQEKSRFSQLEFKPKIKST